MEERLKNALSRLQRLCSQREYCKRDILRKALPLCEGSREDAEVLLKSLEEEGYVDDSRYAAAFALDKSSITGWGPEKISYQLKMKGIDRAVISSALSQIDGSKAEAKLRKLLSTKWKSVCGAPEAKLKLIRFALSRGYSYNTVRPLIEETAAGNPPEDNE